MTTTTSYGTWNNHGDQCNVTVGASIADAISGGDADWRERMGSSGALDRIEADYRAAIDEALPDGVQLCGEEFYGPYDTDQAIEQQMAAFEDDEDPIRSVIEGVDLQAIIEAHDVDAVPAGDVPVPAEDMPGAGGSDRPIRVGDRVSLAVSAYPGDVTGVVRRVYSDGVGGPVAEVELSGTREMFPQSVEFLTRLGGA